MNKVYNFVLFGLLAYAVLASTYKIGYKFGVIDDCMSVHTDWYKKLGITDVDMKSLANFCRNKTREN